MALRILNRQRSCPVNLNRLRAAADCMRRALNVANYDLSIRLTSDPPMRRLNAQHRQTAHSTDVLSFPPQRVHPPHPPPPLAPGVRVLGDIVISVEYVRRNGSELGAGLMQRLERCVAHSLCHLMGYDHEDDPDWAVMDAKEREVMEAWREQQRREEDEQEKRKALQPRRTRRRLTNAQKAVLVAQSTTFQTAQQGGS